GLSMNSVSYAWPRRIAVAGLILRGVALCGGAMAVAHAADSALSIDEAIERARSDSPQVAAAAAFQESAQSLAVSAGRLPDPQAIVGIDNLPVTGDDRYSLTNDFMTMRKAGLMQSVPNGAKRRLQSALAAREADFATAELTASRFEAARAAADTWFAGATTSESLHRLRSLRS